eukprot:TRINITY_DN42892_c0_g1_i1.p2 TRINITY_DN42892_c0_g1~~TRINITY_DN42892_c0_g1_i1.p2  ORF type:complete len:105 (-),score=20.43 TRINITY_DN42892_c0_g1_i1:250-564(-)
MRPILTLAIAALMSFAATQWTGGASAWAASDDLVVKESPHDVPTTLDRLQAVLEDKGITIFARVDHAAGAAKVGEERFSIADREKVFQTMGGALDNLTGAALKP